MPKGDRAILKADPEDGTTPIANLLLEALAMAHLSGEEKGAVLFLWRRTYGWAEGDRRKTEDEISLPEWAAALNTAKDYSARVVKKLVQKRIIIQKDLGKGKGYIYSMNTRVNQWDRGSLNGLLLSKRYSQGLSKKYSPLPPKKTTPSDTNLATPKEILKKELKKDIYIVIFNLWNDLRIISHKNLTSDMKRAIDSARKDYSQEEIEQAMRNYAVIVKGPEYYFNHKWTLAEFLSRRHSNNIERFLDLEIAKSNFKKEASRGAHRQNPRRLRPRETYTRPEDYHA